MWDCGKPCHTSWWQGHVAEMAEWSQGSGDQASGHAPSNLIFPVTSYLLHFPHSPQIVPLAGDQAFNNRSPWRPLSFKHHRQSLPCLLWELSHSASDPPDPHTHTLHPVHCQSADVGLGLTQRQTVCITKHSWPRCGTVYHWAILVSHAFLVGWCDCVKSVPRIPV